MAKSKNEGKKMAGYVLVNQDKLHRAIHGTLDREGKAIGGVGEGALESEVLAAYDKLGGLVMKNGYKIMTGAFYDFKEKKPKDKPEVVFEFRDIAGRKIGVPEGKELPLEVQAAQLTEKAQKEKDKKDKK